MERLDLSQPAVSKHLKVLREAGLIEVRQDAQRRWYRLRLHVEHRRAPVRACPRQRRLPSLLLPDARRRFDRSARRVRNAASWDHCLASLRALLDGREAETFTEWVPAMEHYIAVFGLDEGKLTATGDGYGLHFARDLVWKPAADVWRLLTEDGAVQPGEEHAGRPAGVVRWEIVADPDLSSRVS